MAFGCDIEERHIEMVSHLDADFFEADVMEFQRIFKRWIWSFTAKRPKGLFHDFRRCTETKVPPSCHVFDVALVGQKP
jgi:hypothetical protein